MHLMILLPWYLVALTEHIKIIQNFQKNQIIVNALFQQVKANHYLLRWRSKETSIPK